MSKLDYYKKNLRIIKSFRGAGHYRVYVYYGIDNIGDYLETDMEHIADIDELDIGNESELIVSENFEEVYETTLQRLLRHGECDEDTVKELLNY